MISFPDLGKSVRVVLQKILDVVPSGPQVETTDPDATVAFP